MDKTAGGWNPEPNSALKTFPQFINIVSITSDFMRKIIWAVAPWRADPDPPENVYSKMGMMDMTGSSLEKVFRISVAKIPGPRWRIS